MDEELFNLIYNLAELASIDAKDDREWWELFFIRLFSALGYYTAKSVRLAVNLARNLSDEKQESENNLNDIEYIVKLVKKIAGEHDGKS